MNELDPRLTFDTFVVGPANRLATAAARRAADSPGTSYNPLFLYSNSGLGKSHLLNSVAHHATRSFPGSTVVFTTMELYLDDLARTLGEGDTEELRGRYGDADFLLLDDVQFLTGQPQAQEMVLRTLDALTGSGKQVVLASDRPPSEINGLDERLVSRFSGGLIVDIGSPEYETRVAILRRKAEERGGGLAPGVAEMTARIPFRNVRELQGGLNRILAIQELEGRTVTPDEVRQLLRVDERAGGEAPAPPSPPPPEEPVEGEPTWWELLLEEAAEAEAEGFSAGRLRRMAESGREPEDLPGVLERFRHDLDRLRTLVAQAEALGEGWSGPGPSPLLDPERMEEAEAWVALARERTRPFPHIPPGPDLSQAGNRYPPLAMRAADRLILEERPDYNPLFIVASDAGHGRGLLEAMARSYLFRRPRGRVGLISAAAFAEEFIGTLSDGTASAWRERWGTVDLLLVESAQDLAEGERAQDEFFHVFETVKRRGGRVALTADRFPDTIHGIDDRLRSRFEGGLVVELASPPAQPPASPGVGRPFQVREESAPDDARVLLDLGDIELRDDGRGGLFPSEGAGEEEGGVATGPGTTLPRPPAPGPGVPRFGGGNPASGAPVAAPPLLREPPPPPPRPVPGERWFPSGEKVVWVWPRLDDRLVEEAD